MAAERSDLKPHAQGGAVGAWIPERTGHITCGEHSSDRVCSEIFLVENISCPQRHLPVLRPGPHAQMDVHQAIAVDQRLGGIIGRVEAARAKCVLDSAGPLQIASQSVRVLGLCTARPAGCAGNRPAGQIADRRDTDQAVSHLAFSSALLELERREYVNCGKFRSESAFKGLPYRLGGYPADYWRSRAVAGGYPVAIVADAAQTVGRQMMPCPSLLAERESSSGALRTTPRSMN